MKKIFWIILLFLSVYIFRKWFFIQSLGGQDLFFIFADRLKEFSVFPYAWGTVAENGLGDNAIKFLWTDRYMETIVWFFVNKLGWHWELVQRLFWLWPYLILSIIFPFFLLKNILPNGSKNIFLPVGILIFSFNTYILMVVSGGQINLGLAYMLSPLVFALFIKQLTGDHKRLIITGLILAIQMLFDLRMAYVTMMAVGIYFLTTFFCHSDPDESRGRNLPQNKAVEKDPSTPPIKSGSLGMTTRRVFLLRSDKPCLLLTPLFIAALLHAFWLLPQITVKSATLPIGYESPGWLSFLSWAKFSQSLSLLHPNWPENIFGKTYFMRPEFLMIPMLAYSSLFFIKELTSARVKKMVLFFALLGLLGAFLGKGVNPPWGEVYQWLFSYFPLFWMFRDPTKFYLLIALSYMVLIPVSLTMITDWFHSKAYGNVIASPEGAWQSLFRLLRRFAPRNDRMYNRYQKYVIIIFLAYWLFLLLPVFTGQVKGTLVKQETPKEYYELANFLSREKEFSRTLWVPKIKREAYYTNTHPKVSAEKLFNTTDLPQIMKILSFSKTLTQLQNLAIKYIIVPYDFDGQIFLTERKYDENLYQKTVNEFTGLRVNGLKRVINFGKMVVLEVEEAKGHFWIETDNSKQITNNKKQETNYKMINPAKYEVEIENAKKGDVLVFSERFDKGWVIKSSEFRVQSSKFLGILNSFVLPENGKYTLEVFYEPQKYVVWGSWISVFSLALVIAVLVVLSVLERRNL